MPTSPSAARTARSTLSVDEAQGRVLTRITRLDAVEIPLLDALGTVLAEDAIADRDVPSFRNSAMDGYAVRGADVQQANVRLRVIGSVAAGAAPEGRRRQGSVGHGGRCHRRSSSPYRVRRFGVAGRFGSRA